MEKRIVNSPTELLASFDTRTLKIHCVLKTEDSTTTVYENGRVIFEKDGATHVRHVDVEFASSFGFVKSTNGVKIYKCVDGELTIYDLYNNDIKSYMLPGKNYHVQPGSVNFTNGTYYAIVGLMQELNVNDLRQPDNIRNNEFYKFKRNDKEFILRNTVVYHVTNVDSATIDNQKRMFVKHPILKEMECYDLIVEDTGVIIVLCKKLSYLDNDSPRYASANIFRYDPNIDVQGYSGFSISDVWEYFPDVLITDDQFGGDNLTDFKMMVNVSTGKIRSYDLPDVRRNIRILTDHKFFCDFEDDMSIGVVAYNKYRKFAYIRKTGDLFRSYEETLYSTPMIDFKLTDSMSASEFDTSKAVWYDTVTHCGNSVYTMALGIRGVILFKDSETLFINNKPGFPEGCEARSALYHDGFLYISLMKKGGVLRNKYRDDFSQFIDILASNTAAIDSIVDTNPMSSNIVYKDGAIWFVYHGYHTLYNGTVIDNGGAYKYDVTSGIMTKVYQIVSKDLVGDDGLAMNVSIAGNYIACMSVVPGFIMISPQVDGTHQVIVSPESYSFRKIVGYANKFVGLTYEGELLTFSIYGKSNNIRIISSFKPYTTNNSESIRLSIQKRVVPYVSSMIYFNNKTFVALMVSDSSIKIASIDGTDVYSIPEERMTYLTTSTVPSKDTKLEFRKIDGKLYLFTLDNRYSSEHDCWEINVNDIILTKPSDIKPFTGNHDFYEICKSNSYTNLLVSDDVIVGSENTSDFGATLVLKNILDKRPYRKTRNMQNSLFPAGIFNNDMVLTVWNNDSAQSISITTEYKYSKVKNGQYSVEKLIGFALDESIIYLARDTEDKIHYVCEYSNSAKNIVDIVINIPNTSLLGSPLPGASVYASNIDRWIIGDINNNIVGLRFDPNDPELLKYVVYIGVKEQYILPVHINDEIRLSRDYDNERSYLYCFDPEHGLAYIYAEYMGGTAIIVNNEIGSVIIFDIFNTFREDSNIVRDQYAMTQGRTILEKSRSFSYAPQIPIEHQKFDKNFFARNNFIRSSGGTVHSSFKHDLFEEVADRDTDINYSECPMVNIGDGFKLVQLNEMIDQKTRTITLGSLKKYHGVTGAELQYGSIHYMYFYVEIGDGYDVDYDMSAIDKFLSLFKVGTHGLISQLTFEKDLSNSKNVYFARIPQILISTCILANGETAVYIDPNGISSSLNLKFRFWSNVTYDTATDRTPIKPGYLHENMSIGNFKNIPPNSIGYKSKHLQIIQDYYSGRSDNIVMFDKNTDEYTIKLSITPNAKVCECYHSFEILRIMSKTLILQLVEIQSNGIPKYFIGAKEDSGGVDYITTTTEYSKLDFTVMKDQNGYHVYLGYDKITTIFPNNTYKMYTTWMVGILPFFFGEIDFIETCDTDAVMFTTYGPSRDNLYGKILAMVRDYKTGKLCAIIKPYEDGIIANKSLLKVPLGENIYYPLMGDSNKELTYGVSEKLKFGDIGFVENSSYQLLSFKAEPNGGYPYLGEYINVYRRMNDDTQSDFISYELVDSAGNTLVDQTGRTLIGSTIEL